MNKKPNLTEIAMNEAQGLRMIHVDGVPIWIKGFSISQEGTKPISVEIARTVGSDGADLMPNREG